MSEAIGIMDSAYFVPRKELLKWVNETLSLKVEKIEDLGSGTVYCQLLDAAFGQMVPMHKVNWKAKFQYEFIGNLKIFQDGLQKLMITRKIDIEKLSKAKYQDNLELIQWLKRYTEIHGSFKEGYDPIARRNNAKFVENSKIKKALQSASLNKSNIFQNQNISKGKEQVTKKLFQKENKMMKEKEQLDIIKDILTREMDPLEKLQGIEEIVFGKKNCGIEEEEII